MAAVRAFGRGARRRAPPGVTCPHVAKAARLCCHDWMSRLLLPGLLACASLVTLWACANGLVVTPDDDAGTTPDGSTSGDGSACPQYDLSKDPSHCGSCTHACQSSEVCSGGTCKAACDAPAVKCPGDAGCVDIQTDLDHCGTCDTVCPTPADGGGLPPGTGNPDAGVPFDGGYDGGQGWSVASSTCTKGTCGFGCPQGMDVCGDGICYDLQNHHDHCGDCNTACAADTEWCTQGHCCGVGTEYCNGACTDVLTDAKNCGGCGVTCGQGESCSNGACVKCGGYQALGGCWYTSALGASCTTTCQSHGGFDSVHATHTGNPICTHFFPQKANGTDWVTEECCSTDNNTNWGADGTTADPNYTFAACYLACACNN